MAQHSGSGWAVFYWLLSWLMVVVGLWKREEITRPACGEFALLRKTRSCITSAIKWTRPFLSKPLSARRWPTAEPVLRCRIRATRRGQR